MSRSRLITLLILVLFMVCAFFISSQMRTLNQDNQIQNTMSNIITVQVILKPDNKDISIKDEPITAQNISKYTISAARRSKIKTQLETLGFKIVAEGPFSFSVDAPVEIFERTFSTTISKSGRQSISGQFDTYEFNTPITIPKPLQDELDDVVLPMAPELFE